MQQEFYIIGGWFCCVHGGRKENPNRMNIEKFDPSLHLTTKSKWCMEDRKGDYMFSGK
jgi:hypothetical protein